MKKLLLLLILAASVLSPAAFGQVTTSVTGVVRDLSNAAVTSGQVSFTLQPGIDTAMSGTARFTNLEVDCVITGTGAVKALDGTSTCTVTNNTALQPSGTSYKVCLQPQFIQPGSCFVWYATGTATDITQQVPTPPLTPAYNLVDTFSNQSIAGNKTFTGNVTYSGILTFGSLVLSGPLTANNGGSLGGTFAGNPTFSGNVAIGGNETVGGTLGVTGKVTENNWNSVRLVDGTTLTTIQACINAIPATGGTCLVPPGYTETLAANQVLKSNLLLRFLGPATITQGSFQVTCPSPCDNIEIDGPIAIGANSGGTNNTVVYGYTGSGSSWTLGDSSNRSMNHRVFGIVHDIHSAGTSAIGIDSTLVYHTSLVGDKVVGIAGANSQICVRNNGTALAPGSQNLNIEDSYIQNCKIAYQCIGGNSPPTCNMGVISGGEMTGPGSGIAGSIGVDIENGNNNWMFGATISNYENAVKVNSPSANALMGFYHAESVATNGCASFTASALNNILWSDCGSGVTDSGGIANQNQYHGPGYSAGYDFFYGSIKTVGTANENILRAPLNIQGAAGLPAATTSTLHITGANGAGIVGGIYIGDGTAWGLNLYKRTGSADTQMYRFEDTGRTFFTEAAALAGSAGFDTLWADSTAHRFEQNNNNAGATYVGDTIMQDCGTTTTCSATNLRKPQIVKGNVALSGGTATITGIAPAFTSSTSFECTSYDATTLANPSKAVGASASSITVTGTGTDVIHYVCAGN